MRFSVILFVVTLLISLSLCVVRSQNVETRAFQIIQPERASATSNTAFKFGASLAVKAGNPSTLYAGAPSYEMSATNSSWKPGTVFSCPFDSGSEGVTFCKDKYHFSKNGAMGISVDLEPSATKFVACGHLYVHSCAKASELLVGSCYTQNIVGNKSQALSTPCPALCSGVLIMDMVLAIDDSSSVSPSDFRVALSWLKNLTYGFKDDIDTGDVRIGIYTFSEQPNLWIPLARRSYADLQAAIDTIKQRFGGTDISKALFGAAGEIALRGRPNVDNQIVILTDGFTNTVQVKSTADFLRSTGYTIASVGVGVSDRNQLLDIAGNESLVFTASNFTNLFQVVDGLRLVIQAASTSLEGSGNNGTDFLSRCQIGFSSTVSKTSDLYVGAVGSYDSAGTVVDYRDNDESIKSAFSRYIGTQGVAAILGASDIQALNQSYLGYSVTTGFFLSGIEYIASGAPRYHSKGIVSTKSSMTFAKKTFGHGSLHLVAIYKAFGAITLNGTYHAVRPSDAMWQLGAYFGQSVLGVDLNNDNLDDLLVSAPLYSHQGGYDQGRVFVYMNDPANPGPAKWANSTLYSPQVLQGSKVAGTRFGMSLVNAGDLDQNGFTDLIIGASGEDGGVGSIYVYYLSQQGIAHSIVQTIQGKTLGSGFKLMGYAASKRGVDFDGNGFPDLAVSAPSSDRVVVLRTRPILDVTSRIVLEPPSLDLIYCLKHPGQFCGSVKTCMSAVLRRMSAGKVYDLNTDLILDASSTVKRLHFFNTTLQSVAQNLSVGAIEICQTHAVELQASTITTSLINEPIVIKYSHHLPASHLATKLSPMLDHFTASFKDAVWPVQSVCHGNASVCDYDLTISANFSIKAASEPLVVGADSPIFAVNVGIQNIGSSDSYFTKVVISSPQLSFVQVHGTCVQLMQSAAGSVTLEYVPPDALSQRFMAPGAQCQFALQYSFAPVIATASISQFSLSGEVLSSWGNEKDSSNNKFHYSRGLRYATDLTLSGSAAPSSVYIQRAVTSQRVSSLNDAALGGNVTNTLHTYKIVNDGPNVVANASITFEWPALTADGNQLLYLHDFKCEPTAQCKCHGVNRVDALSLTNNSTNIPLNYTSPTFKPTTLCGDVKCSTIKCTTVQFQPYTSVSITARLKVWLPTFQKINFETSFSTRLTYDTRPSPLNVTAAVLQSTIDTIVTDKAPPVTTDNQTTNILAIVLGILGGIILLVAIVIIMWKCGFFKSKYADMKREAENETSPEDGAVEPSEGDSGMLEGQSIGASTTNLVDA